MGNITPIVVRPVVAQPLIVTVRPASVPVIQMGPVTALKVTVENEMPVVVRPTSLGAKGDKGDMGEPGAAGSSYVHTQSVASNEWLVVHNLGYKPGGIKVLDSAGDEWIGKVTHINNNSYTINFNTSSFAGTVYNS